jgi:hypothetical protein
MKSSLYLSCALSLAAAADAFAPNGRLPTLSISSEIQPTFRETESERATPLTCPSRAFVGSMDESSGLKEVDVSVVRLCVVVARR